MLTKNKDTCCFRTAKPQLPLAYGESLWGPLIGNPFAIWRLAVIPHLHTRALPDTQEMLSTSFPVEFNSMQHPQEEEVEDLDARPSVQVLVY